jgi:hypothetical protein
MELDLQAFLGLLTGLGLSAACGFRVFVPMLVAAIAVRSGAIHVTADFAWIGSTPAIVCFGAATAFEIAGYYLPGVDHFLDVIATPAAVVAGTLLTASFVTDMAPWLRWSFALIAGGGLAAVVQVATVAARGVSLLATFGLANPIVATAELGAATFVSIAAAVVPILALLTVAALVAWLWTRRGARLRALRAPNAGE